MLFGKKTIVTKNDDFESIRKELAKALKIALGYRTITQMAMAMRMVNASPLVDLYNGKINTLPDRKLLRKIALHSEGRLTYKFLYEIVGYSETDPEEDRTWRTWVPKRGCVYFADLGFQEDSIQGGQRPILIIGNDIGNKNADIVLGIPISSKRKASNKLHVHVGKEYNFKEDSYLLCEQVRVMSKRSFFFNGE
jgi:mRNA interferase MazF